MSKVETPFPTEVSELKLYTLSLRLELEEINHYLDWEAVTCWSNIGGLPPIIDKVRGMNKLLHVLITGVECTKDKKIKELEEKHEASEKHWHEIWSRDLDTIADREKEIERLNFELGNEKIKNL